MRYKVSRRDESEMMSFMEQYFGGHISIGNITIYGWNAMHFAIDIKTKKYGYICFHPTIKMFGKWWHWYLYISPNATPQTATWGIGRGFYT